MEKCKCLTAKGDRCSRLGKPEYHGYCFQHKACKTPMKVSPKKNPTKVDDHKRALRKLAKIEALEKRIAAQKQIVVAKATKPKPLPKPIKKVKKVSPIRPINPDLDADTAFILFMHMDPKTIVKVCSSSKYNNICTNKFWRSRLRQDFHIDSKRKTGASNVYKTVAQYYYDIEKRFDEAVNDMHYYAMSVSYGTYKYFMSDEQAKNLFKNIATRMVYIEKSENYGKYMIYTVNIGRIILKNNLSKEDILSRILSATLSTKKRDLSINLI